jgi:hypothetical protein
MRRPAVFAGHDPPGEFVTLSEGCASAPVTQHWPSVGPTTRTRTVAACDPLTTIPAFSPSEPATPGVPARVVTTPALVILRMVSLPVSAM